MVLLDHERLRLEDTMRHLDTHAPRHLSERSGKWQFALNAVLVTAAFAFVCGVTLGLFP